MKRNKFGVLGAGFAMALAGLMGTAQAKGPTLITSHNINEVAKKTQERKKAKEEINVNSYGGLDFNPFLFSDAGLSPKQYGLRYGNGKSRKGKSNRLRLSHNAKLNRRVSR